MDDDADDHTCQEEILTLLSRMVAYNSEHPLAAIGERVRALREREGLSQRGFARAVLEKTGLDMHQGTVSNLEAGKNVTVIALVAIAEATGVSVSQLLDEDSGAPPARLQQLVESASEIDELEIDALSLIAARLAARTSGTAGRPPTESELRRQIPGWRELDERGRDAIREGFRLQAELDLADRTSR